MKINRNINGKIHALYDVPGTSETAIVFVHGNSLDSKYFHQLIKHPDLSPFRKIAIDLPGHGDSFRKSSYLISDLTSALEAVIQDLHLSHFWIVGHSLGGHIVCQSLKNLNPLGIILAATPPLRKPVSQDAFSSFPLMPLFYQERCSPNELLELFNALECPLEYLNSFLATDFATRSSLLEIVQSGAYFDEVEALKEFSGRVTFVVGKRDRVTSSEYVRNLAAEIQADFLELQGNHHFILSEENDFARILYDIIFLGPLSESYQTESTLKL